MRAMRVDMEQYQHQFLDGSSCDLPTGKAICVGLNYAAHTAEMGSQQTTEPLLFMKPSAALVPLSETIAIPVDLGACHFETEMTVLIGQRLSACNKREANAAIAGIGLALDLTLRDLQTELRSTGQPWEKSKSWDGSCPVSQFLKPEKIDDLQNQRIRLYQNNEVRQDGNTAQMLTQVLPLIVYISRFFTLEPGDVVLTGTPEGVGPLAPGDKLRMELGDTLTTEALVAEA